LEHPHRSALENHVHRTPRLGNHGLLNVRIGISPRDTSAHTWMGIAGVTKIVLCRDEEAVAWAIETNRNYPMAHLWLAAALAHLGRLSEMSEAVKTGLALHPSFTIARHRANAWGDNQTYIAQRERLFEGMRKAGVPEG
jgi:hypothetical protein